MAVDKLERLMNLVAALLATPVPLPASTLKERVGGYAESQVAFHRQFSRDKEDLRELGVPIRVESVPESDPHVDGYRIHPGDYYLDDPHLDANELAALHLATRLITVGEQDRHPAGLFKLGGMVAPGGEPVAHLTSMPHDPNLGVLFDALGDGRSVGFSYHGTDRRVVPQTLGFRAGNWYVSAWDQDASEHRLYRLDRIDGDLQPGEVPPDTAPEAAPISSLSPWRIGTTDRFTARIKVAADTVPAVLAQLGEAAVVERDADGAAQFDLEVTNPEGFRSWILGLGTSVEVLGPPEARGMIIDWLTQIVQGRP